MKNMFDYMEKAPSLCEQIIKEKDKRIGNLVEYFVEKERRRIVIVASGSSYNIAMSAKWYLQELLNLEVKVVWPLTYTMYDNSYDNQSFIICMSQSGKSTNTIEAVKKAKELKHDVCVLTTNKNAPIKEYCEHVYEYGSGSDDYYVAKGFPCSNVFLMIFAVEVASRLNKWKEAQKKKEISKIELEIAKLDNTRIKAKKFYEENKEAFLKCRRMMLVGIGSSYGVALEGALKLNEMIGSATNAYEMEEFVHGPTYEIRKDHAIIFIDNNSQCHERMKQLFIACKGLTDHVFVISNAKDYNDQKVLYIDGNSDYNLNIINSIVPFQTFSECICSELDLLSYNLTNYDFEQKIKTKA